MEARTGSCLFALALVACGTDPGSKTGQQAQAGDDSGTDGTDGTDGGPTGCPDAPLLRLVWADRDLTHALMPGFALQVDPAVTRVTETRADLEVLLQFDQTRFQSVRLTALAGENRQTLFEDRMQWSEAGLPSGEERWIPDGEGELVRETQSTFGHDADGHRLDASLHFDDGRPSLRLSWAWEGDCLVAYDRNADDGRPGSTLSCTTGDRVAQLLSDDGSPPQRYRWPADPPAAPGPDGLDEDEGSGFIFAEEWTWGEEGDLRAISRADGSGQRFETDAAGSLVATLTTSPGAEDQPSSTWAIACD